MVKVQYEEMLPHEVVAARTACPVAYLPVGTLEWHGVHNPVGLDTLKARALCVRAAEEFGGVAMPALWWGEHREKELVEVIEKAGVGEHMGWEAEVFDEGGVAPDRVDVVWNGEHGSMNLEYGVPARGVYLTSRDLAQALETEEPGCYEYYFEAAWGETTARFPETGSYGWGDCTFADGDAKWLARQLEPDEGGGCSSVGAPAGLVATFAGLLVLARRRRED